MNEDIRQAAWAWVHENNVECNTSVLAAFEAGWRAAREACLAAVLEEKRGHHAAQDRYLQAVKAVPR